LRDYLEVDLEPITKKLQAEWPDLNAMARDGTKTTWLGPKPALGERLDGQDHLDHYQGDFKKYKRSWM
jgi:alkaline phosphatase